MGDVIDFEKQMFEDFDKLDKFEDSIWDNDDFLPDSIEEDPNSDNYFYPDSYQFKDGYPLERFSVIERSTYRSLIPNWNGEKKILRKDNKIKTIVEGKLRPIDFIIIDYLTTKLYEKLIIALPQENTHDRWFLPAKKIEEYLSFYLTGNINTEFETNLLHSVKFFNLVLKSRDMIKVDPHFNNMLRQFNFNSPRGIEEMFSRTSNVLFNVDSDVLVRDEKKEDSKLKKLKKVNNLYRYDKDPYNNTDSLYPKSKLFNIRMITDRKERCREATYYINFNSFMGTILLLNVYNSGVKFLPMRFYKLSQYAQYIYKFIILTTYNEEQHASIKLESKIYDKIHPVGITYKHIGDRLSIFNQSNFRQIINKSLDELRKQNFIYSWNKVGKDKIQILYYNKNKTDRLKNRIK